MNDIFHFVERPYNLKSNYTLERKRNHIVYHGSESLPSLAPKLWDLLSNSINLSRNSRQKLILEHLTAVLPEYARNMFGG